MFNLQAKVAEIEARQQNEQEALEARQQKEIQERFESDLPHFQKRLDGVISKELQAEMEFAFVSAPDDRNPRKAEAVFNVEDLMFSLRYGKETYGRDDNYDGWVLSAHTEEGAHVATRWRAYFCDDDLVFLVNDFVSRPRPVVENDNDEASIEAVDPIQQRIESIARMTGKQLTFRRRLILQAVGGLASADSSSSAIAENAIELADSVIAKLAAEGE